MGFQRKKWCRFRDGGAYFVVGGGGGGGLDNECRRREFVGGCRGILPQKILKSRGSETVFSTLSMKYFLKNNLNTEV